MDSFGLYLSLGSNLGDREGNLRSAIKLLEDYFSSEAKVSSFIETEPWGFDSSYLFINCAVRFDIPAAGQNPDLHSHRILKVCKEIEASLGRESDVRYDANGKRIYSSRPIDIDILFYGSHRVNLQDLTIPHPLISERDFVKIPLKEIASEDIIECFPHLFSSK